MSRNSFGFTIMEIMIILLLLGIVLAVAVPSINNTLDEMKLDGAAQEVVYALQYVQSLSIKEGVVYGVQFFPSTNSFRCYEKNSDGTILNPLDKKPYVVDFDGEGHLQGVDLVSTTFGMGKKVEFSYLGQASESGSVILDYAGLQKTIDVAVPIGRVTVQ